MGCWGSQDLLARDGLEELRHDEALELRDVLELHEPEVEALEDLEKELLTRKP